MPKMPKFLLFLSLALFTLSTGITSASRHYREAPQFYNFPVCSSLADDDVDPDEDASHICSDQVVHVAMNLDTFNIRGSMGAILFVLQHSCPENIVSHFIASASFLRHTISLSFSYLNFRVYQFDDSAVSGLIATSIRSALDCPLSYARRYLANLLPLYVCRLVYLDSDLILVDNVAKLGSHPLDGNSVLATPEYCNANFTAYFTPTFWSNPSLWDVPSFLF